MLKLGTLFHLCLKINFLSVQLSYEAAHSIQHTPDDI